MIAGKLRPYASHPRHPPSSQSFPWGLFVFIRVHSCLPKNPNFPRYIAPDFAQYSVKGQTNLMKTKILRNILISLGVLFALARPLSAVTNDGALNFGNMPLGGHPPTYTSFDVPGALFTLGICINPGGVISGTYLDASGVIDGYVRDRNGAFTTFAAPGAGTGQTQPLSINPGGAIAGWFLDPGNVFHGFRRAPDGTITTFDAPGAGTGPFQGTVGTGINPAGVIAGTYFDAGNALHGFVRPPDGIITTF